jgi:hypothetical protein
MLGYRNASDLVGKNPVTTSPPFQPGGRLTTELARQYIVECVKNGTARFE